MFHSGGYLKHGSEWGGWSWMERSSWQYQPTLDVHDPNPPITLEEPSGASVTGTLDGSLALSGSASAQHGVAGTLAGTLTPTGAIAAVHGVTSTFAGSLGLVGAFAANFASGVTGTLVGTLGLTGAFSGVHKTTGTFVGTLGLTSAIAMQRGVASTFAGSLALTSAVAASHGVAATAAGTLGLAGAFAAQFLGPTTGTLAGTLALASAIAARHGIAGASAGSLALSGAFAGQFSSAVIGTLSGSLGLAGAFSGISGAGTREVLRQYATRALRKVTAIWRPSAMQGNATPTALDRYAAIPGPNGITRLAAPFGAYDMSAATDLADYLSRTTTYLNLPEVQAALDRGTCIFEITGTPKFLSSSADETVLGGSGWKAYRTARPADLSPGGTWQTAMQALVNLVRNTFGITAPRDAITGKVVIGRPGLIFQFMNEPNNEVFWGYNGLATFGDYLLSYQRFCEGARVSDPRFAVCGPVTAGVFSTRTDKLYATTSADVLPGGRSAGGTEGTGRFLSQALRSYWRFDVSRLVNSAISSAHFLTTNATAVGTIAADTWSFRPYNANGQGDPAADSDATAHARCASGTAYVSGDTTWRTTGAKDISLGATAGGHIQAAIAGGNYSVTVTMAGEGSGGDRYANPLGYDDGTQSNRPQLTVQYTKSLTELFLDYVGANQLELDAVDVHSFQTAPDEFVASGAALIRAGLISAGLPAETPVIVTEFQDINVAPGIRDDYRTAAYFYGALHAHWQADYDAMAMATLLKLGAAPSSPNLFTDEWGMITNGTVNGFYCNTSQFMAMTLLARLTSGEEIVPVPAYAASTGVRQYAARTASTVCVALSRWNPGGAAVAPIRLQPNYPGVKFTGARVWRFDATTNDPVAVFSATVGTYAQKCAAAVAAGNTPTFVDLPAGPVDLDLATFDAAFIEFTFSRIGGRPKPSRQQLENEVREWYQEPDPLELEVIPQPTVEVLDLEEPGPAPIPPVLGLISGRLFLSGSVVADQTSPYDYARQKAEDILLLLGEL